jgi:hypothetical protein
MSVFKVTLLVSDGLALGSVLMTNHVELLHIQEVEEHVKYMGKTHIEHDTKLLLNADKNKSKIGQKHFIHPTGKTTLDFTFEFLQKHKTATWREMSKHIVSLGYNKSSINNAVVRLVNRGLVEKVKPGVYQLAQKGKKVAPAELG